MKDFPEKLQMIIDERSITKTALGKLLGVTSSQIGHYVKGRRVPPIEQLVRLEKVLSIPAGWLIYGDKLEGIQNEHKVDYAHKSIPILPIDTVKNYVKNGTLPIKTMEVSLMGIDKNLSPRGFLMQVVGDAMVSTENPRLSINNLDYIVVDPQAVPEIGSIVVITTKESDIKIRKYMQDGSEIFFKAFDAQYPPIKSDEAEILGVVKQKITSFDK